MRIIKALAESQWTKLIRKPSKTMKHIVFWLALLGRIGGLISLLLDD